MCSWFHDRLIECTTNILIENNYFIFIAFLPLLHFMKWCTLDHDESTSMVLKALHF